MQAVAVILLLITIGSTVGPVGAVAVIYRDDLSELVVPPQIQDIINGDSSLLAQNVVFDDSVSDQTVTGDIGPMGFVMPKFVSATVDAPTKTFSVTVNVTDFLKYDLTLNTISATVLNSDNNLQLASINLANSLTIQAGKSDLVTVSGVWTQAAEDYYYNNPNAQTINIKLVDIVVDVNGIKVQTSQPIDIGTIPLSLEGLQ